MHLIRPGVEDAGGHSALIVVALVQRRTDVGVASAFVDDLVDDGHR